MKKITLSSINSVPNDVLSQLDLPFQLGPFLEWAKDNPLPGCAGEMWKFRRAELAFEIDDSVECDACGVAGIHQLGLDVDDIFTHEEFISEMEHRGERLLLKLMLREPNSDVYWGSGRGRGLHPGGEAFLFVTEEEYPRYKLAVHRYCMENSIGREDLTFDDGIKCFLGEYLPREFTVVDACITNLSRVWTTRYLTL